MQYTDVMVDLETTGLNPDENAIIQIAGVRFNIENKQVDTQFFDRCLRIPQKRFWDEGTRDWWLEKEDLLRSLYRRMEDPAIVIKDFQNFCMPVMGQQLRWWSKPSHFDYPFVQSYMKQFGLQMPFDFREANDLRSFLRGVHFPKIIPEVNVSFEGEAHNAIFDTLHQIKILFEHLP